MKLNFKNFSNTTKIMKRIKLLLLLLAMTLCVNAAWSQTEHVMTKEELRQITIETNARLPISMGQMMELSSMSLSESELLITIGVNDAFGTFAQAAKRPADQLKESAIMALGTIGDEDMSAMVRAVAANGLNLHIVYAVVGTDTKVGVLLTPSDLQKIMQMDKSPLAFLEQMVKSSQQSLPMSMGNGLTMIELKMSDHRFEYVFQIDESIQSMNVMMQQEAAVRQAMEQMLGRGNDVTVVMQLSAMVECGMDLVYTYIGSVSRKKLSIAIPSKRLSELLGN